MNDLSKTSVPSLPIEDLRVDSDPVETAEWLAGFESLVRESGTERAQHVYDQRIKAENKRKNKRVKEQKQKQKGQVFHYHIPL
jgi:pyruvate dehydrogenase complex dehydrogenase (E1) component